MFRGVARGGFQGFWNPPPPHPFAYIHDYNFKRTKGLEPPFLIPRDKTFASEEKDRKIYIVSHAILMSQYYKDV